MKFIKKYCYVTIPMISIIILLILNKKNILIILDRENFSETLISISGNLIGFLFTAITIFLSLNKESNYMRNLKKYNHHIIFGRLVSCGIISLMVNIISWIFNWDFYIFTIAFIIGLEETVMAAYYTYKISLNSFK